MRLSAGRVGRKTLHNPSQGSAAARQTGRAMTKQSMRELMPICATWVDWMRELLGKPAADRIVADGMRGRGTFWFRERGPDGVWREVGSRRGPAPSGAPDRPRVPGPP
jgi:hypothetical protein